MMTNLKLANNVKDQSHVTSCYFMYWDSWCLLPPQTLLTHWSRWQYSSLQGHKGFHWRGHGNSLQYSCLEKPRDRGAWRATVRGVGRVGHDLVTIPLPLPKGSTRMLVPHHPYSWWEKRGSLPIISHSKYFSPTSSQMRRRPFTTIMYCLFFF